MSFLNKFFESSFYCTLKAYTVFLTFLNIPYFLASLVGKSSITVSGIAEGSSFMLTVQVRILKWLVDWIGLAMGNKALFSSLEKTLAGYFSADAVFGIIAVLGLLLAILIFHLAIKLFGRFIPALADLHSGHRPNPWSMLYLLLFLGYIFIYITA